MISSESVPILCPSCRSTLYLSRHRGQWFVACAICEDAYMASPSGDVLLDTFISLTPARPPSHLWMLLPATTVSAGTALAVYGLWRLING